MEKELFTLSFLRMKSKITSTFLKMRKNWATREILGIWQSFADRLNYDLGKFKGHLLSTCTLIFLNTSLESAVLLVN